MTDPRINHAVLPLFQALSWDQSYLFLMIYCGISLTSFSGFIVGSVLPFFQALLWDQSLIPE
jgi:hypothetical protein